MRAVVPCVPHRPDIDRLRPPPRLRRATIALGVLALAACAPAAERPRAHAAPMGAMTSAVNAAAPAARTAMTAARADAMTDAMTDAMAGPTTDALPAHRVVNALYVSIIDDDDPPRFAAPDRGGQCGEATAVQVDGAPMRAGERIPGPVFRLSWHIDGCRPLGDAGPLLSGRYEVLVMHDDEHGPGALLLAHDPLDAPPAAAQVAAQVASHVAAQFATQVVERAPTRSMAAR